MTKCKVCRSEFVKRSMTHKCCTPACAEQWVAKENARNAARKARDERRQDATAKLRLKTWREWDAECLVAFNRYIRARDQGKPCICCARWPGDVKRGGNVDSGHYRSRGSSPHLRFDERNAHGQLAYCNRYMAGNAVAYRAGLIARIGLEAVEALEADQTPRKYTIDQLKAMKADYNARARALEKAHEAEMA